MKPSSRNLWARRCTAGLSVLAGWLATSAPVLADWPVARHDVRRTAASPATSDITKPAAYWRMYLGGQIDGASVVAADVDGNGQPEVLYIDTGRVVARRLDGQLAWRSSSLGFTGVVGVGDLDGDGVPDVLARSGDHAYVLVGFDGAVEWAEPDGEMGTLAVVRLADLDGDGLPDLLVQEHGCAAVNSGKTGFAYSFAAGFDAAKLLYSLPWKTCGARVTTVADLDGLGAKALAVPNATNDGLALLDGATGAPLAETAAFAPAMSLGFCVAANVDQVPGDELVCMQNDPGYGGERQVFVVHYSASPAPGLGVSWKQVIGDKTDGDVAVNADSVVDLDGDGATEVVVAGKTAAGWTTHVYAGATGVELGTIPSARFVGTAALESPTQKLILTSSGGTLSAYAFVAGATPPFVPRWTLPGRILPERVDAALAAVASLATRGAHADVNGDGLDEIVVTTTDATAVGVYSAANGSLSQLGQLSLPDLVRPTAFWALAGQAPGSSLLGVARNDGYLMLLDGHLTPSWGPDGAKVGGYYSNMARVGLAPVAAALGAPGGPQSMLVVDSRGALLRVDPQHGSFAAPPKPAWAAGGKLAPTIVPGADQGAPGIACFSASASPDSAPTFEVSLLRRDGTPLWSKPFPWDPPLDLLPGDVDGDGLQDLFVQGYDDLVAVHTRAVSGKDGSTLWDFAPVPMGGGVQLFSSTDWNGDGRPDLLTVLGNVNALSGVDGSVLASSPVNYAYFAPIPLDVNGDGMEELVLQGGALPTTTLEHDLTTPLWTSSDNDHPLPYGAIARCAATPPLLVEGASEHPARLKITPLSGPSAGKFSTLVLAAGKRYGTEAAAQADGASLGRLGNVTVEGNLTGTKRPSAVVGSTDGWLYAVDPCTGDLDFALEIGAAVGEAIFADTDGDGRDEILVTAADGYLYDIRNKAVNAPSFVWDIDPVHGVVDHDVADVETVDTLSGRWGAVSGASGYEVAVVDQKGDYVTSPYWQPVGTSLETSVSGLALSDGAKYVFAVRAVGKDGPSPDVVSDGVVVHFPQDLDAGPDGGDAGVDAGPEDAGADGGDASAGPSDEDLDLLSGRACTCRDAGRSPSGGGTALALGMGLLVAAARRRFPHPARCWRRFPQKRERRR